MIAVADIPLESQSLESEHILKIRFKNAQNSWTAPTQAPKPADTKQMIHFAVLNGECLLLNNDIMCPAQLLWCRNVKKKKDYINWMTHWSFSGLYHWTSPKTRWVRSEIFSVHRRWVKLPVLVFQLKEPWLHQLCMYTTERNADFSPELFQRKQTNRGNPQLWAGPLFNTGQLRAPSLSQICQQLPFERSWALIPPLFWFSVTLCTKNRSASAGFFIVFRNSSYNSIKLYNSSYKKKHKSTAQSLSCKNDPPGLNCGNM